MKITLFEAAVQVRALLEAADPETGELDESYSQTYDLFNNKAAGCIAYVKEKTAELEAARGLLAQMQAKVQSAEKHLERFKGYIIDGMKTSGTHEIGHQFGLFKAKLYLGRDEAVELDAGAQFPPELCSDPKPPPPSKSKIKAAIKAGQPVAGARIVRRDRLTIS